MSLIESLKRHAANRPTVKVKLRDVLANCDDEAEFAVRVLVAGEIAEATAAAVEERKRVLASVPEQQRASLVDDPTILEDSKLIEIVWRACRDLEDLSKPAFPSAAFLRASLTNEEFDGLYAIYQRAERLASRAPQALSIEQRFAMALVIAANADSQAIDNILLAMPKVALADFTAWLAAEWSKQAQAVANALEEPKTGAPPTVQ